MWRELSDTTLMVQSTIAGGISASIDQLGADVWEAAKGTQEWSQAWKNMGNMAGRILTQIITQMIVVQSINGVLGLFGKGLNSTNTGIVTQGTPTTMPTTTRAGGGTFMTQGPTHLVVGDNPGGVELVSVTPISGVGRSTINGRVIEMAGGGTLLAAGNRAAAAEREGVTINQTFHFGAGVSRAEFLGVMPQMIEATKAAVLDAQKRRLDGFR